MAKAPDSLLTLEGFLAHHPWPERFLADGTPMDWLWDYELSVAPDELWPHLIDTSRLNRALGLGEMSFEEIDGVLRGTSVNGGRTHEWVEEPWTWVTGQSLTAVRVYSRGWAHVARAIYHVVSSPTPRLAVYFGWVPRGIVGKLALKIGVPPMRKAYDQVLTKLQADIDKPRPEPYVAEQAPLAEAVVQRIEELRPRLLERGVAPSIIKRLFGMLESGDDMDLYRIQPRKLAHEWGIEERELLTACLHATRIGVLDLSWDVICPHCRGVRDESTRLAGVANAGSCDVCDVDFSTDLENAVEVTFHVHASIRDVPKVYYCSAEPATKQHIKLQQSIAAGESNTINMSLAEGRYRMRLLGDRISGFLTIRSDASESVSWTAGDEVGELEATPQLSITLTNPADTSEMFVIEEARWADEALRPSMLFAQQEFRDLFSEEYLGSDVQLSVGEQTLLFTDMVGSTAFYREYGDPAAFVKVKGHFEAVFEIIRNRNGAVVKTIGDAVMAVFSDPLDAVRASSEINLRFPFSDEKDAIRLRVSLNSGPCIAVNLNTGIDYFGATVNTAAKLQACCEAGEVALSRNVFEAPGVRGFFDETSAAIEERSFTLGAESIDYVFWSVSSGPT